MKYKDDTITVKENNRRTRRFRNIDEFHVYNRIEGYLTFKDNSKPRNRNFPGYGKSNHLHALNNYYD